MKNMERVKWNIGREMQRAFFIDKCECQKCHFLLMYIAVSNFLLLIVNLIGNGANFDYSALICFGLIRDRIFGTDTNFTKLCIIPFFFSTNDFLLMCLL